MSGDSGRDGDPFTMEMLLCVEGHLLASSEPQGAYPNGYECTGHAHKFGQHIRCTWLGHDISNAYSADLVEKSRTT